VGSPAGCVLWTGGAVRLPLDRMIVTGAVFLWMDASILLAPLYADLLTDRPWVRFLAALAETLPCRHPTIVARSPRTDDPGLLVSSEPDHGGATPYRRWLFDQTPFRDLPIGEVHTLRGMLSDSELKIMPYYRDFLAPAGILDLFAVDLRDSDPA
jgi:hypothetical protein